MCSVRFYAEGARLMLGLLERLTAGEDVPEAELQAVLDTPAYRLFFTHHNRFAGGSLVPPHPWLSTTRPLASCQGPTASMLNWPTTWQAAIPRN